MSSAEKLLPDGLGPDVGLLSEANIRKAVQSGFLFERSSFREANATLSGYDMRVGRRCSRADVSNYDSMPVSEDLLGGKSIRMPPGTSLTFATEEKLKIPANVLARITISQRPLLQGFAAESAFADPGYSGAVILRLSNVSRQSLSIAAGDPLAWVEFHKFLRIARRVSARPTGVDAPGFRCHP